jgi:hypothetical protein
MKFTFAASLFLLLAFANAQSSEASTNLEALARNALSENAAESGRAIAELRAMGPAGLDTLFQLYSEQISRRVSNPLEPSTPEWQRLSTALDRVSRQKDSYLAGLYWYTDLAQAEAAAKSSSKPILSLRLLGNLDEEFSCANSRFFRSVLYPNAAVSAVLRERFILHWQSVRPAPRVTIDFGDGRKLERTITGNSIHYLLDSEGHILDALPGLYGPQAFLRQLTLARVLCDRLQGQDVAARFATLDDYHRGAIRTITAGWLHDNTIAGGNLPRHLIREKENQNSPRAIEIAPLAMPKMAAEAGILKAITRDADALGSVTDEAAWTRIAEHHLADAQLDQRSLGLIQRQTQKLLTADASGSAQPKFKALVQKFQLNVALDTVRNEYVMHSKLHAWLIADPLRNDLNAFNEKVYAQLFLTPRSDPWLGLYSADVYTGLENAGVNQ